MQQEELRVTSCSFPTGYCELAYVPRHAKILPAHSYEKLVQPIRKDYKGTIIALVQNGTLSEVERTAFGRSKELLVVWATSDSHFNRVGGKQTMLQPHEP